nr:unnamed protein product [Callosobruchus analis]
MDPCVIYASIIIKRRKRRRWSVHPLNAVRHLRGAFYTLYEELRNHEEKFFNFFKMSIYSVDELCFKVRNTITSKKQLVQGLCFQPEEMMAVTIRFLGSGCTYTELHYEYRMGIATISLIVKSMCNVIWVTISEDVFLSLDCDETVWRDVANGFMTRTNFPHCVGAIDGKQVRVVKPRRSGSLFYITKTTFLWCF